MAKAKHTDLGELLSPEQRVEIEGQGMADLYFLALPRQTLEELNQEAKRRGMTLAQALGQAFTDWLGKKLNE